MCIFCNFEKLAILFQNAKYCVIQDIKPAVQHHYLVIPKEHLPNPKYLNKTHAPIIEEMKEVALNYAKENILNFDQNKLRLGFHWAPFNSIGHLHLHVLYPIDEFSFFQKYIYNPKMWCFSEVDDTIKFLENQN